MISQELRRKFLKYFKDKGHAAISSSSVVPHDDPTLLFTNAGMNQFKDVFVGTSPRDYKRATTSQKCIRVGGKHNDLDNVGHTSRHLTFFEMLGNFSFGDYFKKEAILYAWEVATQVFGLDPNKIWPTVFETDDEAFELWKRIVPEKRIVRLGEKDNFWAMGETGPCGPCSELLYDKGPSFGGAHSPKEDLTGERFFEFWNLVFMQFNRDTIGKMTPLPRQSIDTGAGLERVVSLKMGVNSVFETDILKSLINQIENISRQKYSIQDKILAPAFHVIADHIRSLSFAIADGAQPSNIERGYVLRKLLRRAVRYGRMLGFQEPFMAEILPSLVETMGADYPELKASQNRIAEILTLEEEAFLRTLKRGGNILSLVIDKAKATPAKEITGEEAFKLKDTYGLPLEEILLIAKDTGLQVNLESYQLLEEKAKQTSRAAHVTHAQQVKDNVYKEFADKQGLSEFTGYHEFKADSAILGILVGGSFVNTLKEGEEGALILKTTPFYAEKGGQVGDTGSISSKESLFTVSHCTSPYPGLILHIGKCLRGSFSLSHRVHAQIEGSRRQEIQNNHTATHLLHWALHTVLGSHIQQAGSLVEEERLRFDFNHHKALSHQEIHTIEDLVNAKIRDNTPVDCYQLSYEEAQKRSDIKQFFGDKYGSQVRVVDIAFCKELCGGTHTSRTGTIGYFRIAKEASIAAGVRRIEAVTGKAAEALVRHKEQELEKKIIEEQQKLQELLKQFKATRRLALKEMSHALSQKTLSVGKAAFLAAIVSVSAEELPLIAEDLMGKQENQVVLLATKTTDRCQLLVRVSPDLVQKGIQAVQIIKQIAPLIGGSGGGKADSAQAGGKDPSGIEQAFEKTKQILNSVQ
jgi:alanyl-tRNA synthetase